MKLLNKKNVGIFLILIFAVAYFYNLEVERQELELKIQRLEVKAKDYDEKLKVCVPTSIVHETTYSSDPRTNDRLIQIVSIFNQIINASCFKSYQGIMLSNPYKDIRLGELGTRQHNLSEDEIFKGFLYEYDKGVPFLRSGWTLCEDGSLSGSIGRGTCSWHGGYAKQRGEKFNFDFAERIPNPRDKIAELLNK